MLVLGADAAGAVADVVRLVLNGCHWCLALLLVMVLLLPIR